MPATQKARAEFIARIVKEFPACPDAEHIARMLLRNAATYQRLAEESCNGHPIQSQCPPSGADMVKWNARVSKLQDAWGARIEKQEAACERRIAAYCAQLGCPVRFGGDPRGFVVNLALPSGAYNSWGGAEEGWGVPS